MKNSILYSIRDPNRNKKNTNVRSSFQLVAYRNKNHFSHKKSVYWQNFVRLIKTMKNKVFGIL